jgi:hypothetical protein
MAMAYSFPPPRPKSFFGIGIGIGANARSRVEKYRPNTLEDVSGHHDILATINKFVDMNVWLAE